MIGAQKKLPVEEAVNIARRIADGVGAAHDRGIIHRDIKPENVMIASDGDEVKIMDFGLARVEAETRMTVEGRVMGTWAYMAPEQVQGQRPKPSTDVYAIGIMLFEMLAGQSPFPEDGDLSYHHVNTVPPRLGDVAPEVTASLSSVVEKCLAKDPDERYADGRELLEALNAVGIISA